MKLDTLDGLNDGELQAVIARSQELLKRRDEERKANALAEARAILAAAGLSLSDIAKGNGVKKNGKPAAGRDGRPQATPPKGAVVEKKRQEA
jgi:hypothetical protein